MGKIKARQAAAIRWGIERARTGSWVEHPGMRSTDALLAFEAYLRNEQGT